MRILALDPGPTDTAWVVLDDGVPVDSGEWKNEMLVVTLTAPMSSSTFGYPVPDLLAIEDFISYGQRLDAQSIATIKAIGDFRTAWNGPHVEIPRPEVRRHLCYDASTRIKDADIKEALQRRFGGRVRACKGRKCSACKGKGWVGRGRPSCGDCGGSGWDIPPGPLRDFSGSHQWAALAVAVTVADQEQGGTDAME